MVTRTLEAMLDAFLERWQRARYFAELRMLYRAVTGSDAVIQPYMVQILDRVRGKLVGRYEERVEMREATP